MKKYILIAMMATGLLSAGNLMAQEKEGPQAQRKEMKMDKKENKAEKKDYKGSDRKAMKKKEKAEKKSDKMDMKEAEHK